MRNKWSIEQSLELAAPPATAKYRGEVITAFGKRFGSLNACARHFKIKPETLRRRVREVGQDVHDAIRELRLRPKPGSPGLPVKTLGKSFSSIAQCAAHYRLSLHSSRNRLRYQKESVKEAVTYLRKLQARRTRLSAAA